MPGGKTPIRACLVPAFAACQYLACRHPLATFPKDRAADATVVCLTADGARALFPASSTLNKAIPFRKFSLLTGADKRSRRIWTNPNLGAGTGSCVAMGFSGLSLSRNAPPRASIRKAALSKCHRNGTLP